MSTSGDLPAGAPSRNARVLERLRAVGERHVLETGVARAVGLGFAARAGGDWHFFHTTLGELASGDAAGDDTLFDLASVTKPVVACVVARLAAASVLALREPLGEFLPELRETPAGRAPLELLLAHRAGLEAHVALFAPLVARRAWSRPIALEIAARSVRAECGGAPPLEGFPPLYSDLGYLLAGEALERRTRRPLDALVAEEVSTPLGLRLGSVRRLVGAPAEGPWRAAPTEVVRARGGLIQGAVHDDNAWALAGYGTAGHAGLFGDAASVLRFGAALLDVAAGRSGWLEAEAFANLLRERPGGSLRAGFDGKSEHGSSAGERASRRTFGHLGFTGTSLWCDPSAEAAVTLLTNRVHPTRDNLKIRAARPAVHDALFEEAERLRGLPSPAEA